MCLEWYALCTVHRAARTHRTTLYSPMLQSGLIRIRLEGNHISRSEIDYALSTWQRATTLTLSLSPQLVEGQKFDGLLALCQGKTEYFEANLGQVLGEVAAVPLPHISSRACCLLTLAVPACCQIIPLMRFQSPWRSFVCVLTHTRGQVPPSSCTRDEVFSIWKASCYLSVLDHTNKLTRTRSTWEQYLTAGQDTAGSSCYMCMHAFHCCLVHPFCMAGKWCGQIRC
jgi:hypothetical protein